MHYAANAYSKVAQTTQSPRELEATILMKAATRLQAIRDDWDSRNKDLDEALTYNRKLWTVLVSVGHAARESAAAADQAEHRQSRPVHLQPHAERHGDPDPARLAVLVTINREIAAGLRGMGAPQSAA